MSIALLFLYLVSATLESPPTWEQPLSLTWPFSDALPRSIAIGYGDWCIHTEGPHPGIDFYASQNDYLRNPLERVDGRKGRDNAPPLLSAGADFI